LDDGRLRSSPNIDEPDPREDGLIMIRELLRWFGLFKADAGYEKFEPVYGLPKQSLQEWLSRNPSMRERYAADLARASKGRRRNYKEDRDEMVLDNRRLMSVATDETECDGHSLSDPFARPAA